MNVNRKTHRSVSPLGDHNSSPDIVSKFNLRNLVDTAADSYANMGQTRQFSESPDNVGRRKKDQEYYWGLSIAEINLQLDNNMNEIIFLLGKRKILVQVKKRKLMEDLQERIYKSKLPNDLSQFQFMNDEDFLKVTNFCQNPKTSIRMLGKIIESIPEIKGPRNDEEDRSEQFWMKNRKLQNQIDVILQKLKVIDKNLEKQNGEVHQMCKQLDRIEQTLKSFVGAKSLDHVQKVEPLFNSKKRNYDALNKKIKDREYSKDKKIDYIKKIKGILEQLKITRQERLHEIAQFFGLENLWEFQKIQFKEQGDFTNGFEELLKIKQKEAHLQLSERQAISEIQVLQKQQDKLYSEMLRKQSDEAKAFHNYNNVMNQRIKYNSIMSVFGSESQGWSLQDIDSKQISKKFKDYKVFFKRFIDEDALLKQGLVKTAETSKTFVNLLRATQNEKQRRHQLLGLLEACIKKRGDYEQKRQELRNTHFDESRREQELTQFEDELEAILTDGDLQGYKSIGIKIGKCQQDKVRLNHIKQLLEKQMQSMDRQVLSLANRIQEDYQDILCDVLPSDYQYSLKTGQDVKKLRNHLRKMYKRLGILNSE